MAAEICVVWAEGHEDREVRKRAPLFGCLGLYCGYRSRPQIPRLREASNEREAPMYNSQLQVIFASEGLNNG
jgi:hypothetical protein